MFPTHVGMSERGVVGGDPLIRSSEKGASFEREICRKFSLWWSMGDREDIFWRTSGSGARATQRGRRNGLSTANSSADMAYLDEVGKPFLDVCCVEMKRGYSSFKGGEHLDILELLDRGERKKALPLFLRFWGEISEKAASLEKEPVLIFRRDRHQSCVVFRSPFFKSLERNWGGFEGSRLILSLPDFPSFRCLEDYSLVVLLLEEFFSWGDPRHFFRMRE